MQSSVRQIGPVKNATLILGDKWTPELLRLLANESSVGFCQLQDMAGSINPRTLSQRLAALEHNDIIKKCPTPKSSRCRYQLTPKGKDLVPVLLCMQDWTVKYAKTP